MSIVGIEPIHEVILPDSLRRRYDDIQDQILHMQTKGDVEIINLGDAANSPLAEYGSHFQELSGLTPLIPVLVLFAGEFSKDLGYGYAFFKYDMVATNPLILLLPVISGLAVFGLLFGMYMSYRAGVFKSHVAIYRQGLLRISQGMAGFARWEELQSIEKVKSGLFRITPLDPRIRPHNMSVGKSHADEFERIMRRLGVLSG